MTITEHQRNIQTFLSYDFANGPSQGRLLFLTRNEKGDSILREVNVSKLNFAEKFELYFSEVNKLGAIANYVQTLLNNEALLADAMASNKWKKQVAYLQQKVERYNKNHWFSGIDFDNPLIEKMQIQVSMPEIPNSLGGEKTLRRLSLRISYTPFTTFAAVEAVIQRVIGPEGFLVDGDDTDRRTILNLAKRKVTICSWLMANPDRQLKIVYKDIKLDRYLSYCHEKGFVEGYYQGFASGLFNSAPRTSRRMMMDFPELESDKVKTEKDLYEKYNEK